MTMLEKGMVIILLLLCIVHHSIYSHDDICSLSELLVDIQTRIMHMG